MVYLHIIELMLKIVTETNLPFSDRSWTIYDRLYQRSCQDVYIKDITCFQKMVIDGVMEGKRFHHY